MKLGARQEVAKKMAGFLKKAQAEAPTPGDEEAAIEDVLPDPEDLEDLEDLGEDLEDKSEEHDEEEEELLESLEEKIEDIDEKLDTVVDALEDHKEILEEGLMGEEGMEEEFEDFKEDQDEDNEDEFTSEEFGIETESTKEEGMKSGSLRKLRNARLMKRKSLRDYGEDKTLREEFNEPATTKKKFAPQSPAPSISKVKPDTIPDMLKLAELSLKRSDDKNSWTVVDGNDTPLYTIHRGKLDVKVFASKKFAEKIIKEMAKNGIGNTLKKYQATKVVKAVEDAEIPEDQVPENPEIEANPAADSNTITPEQYKQAHADVRRRFLRAVRLSLQMMNKNLIQPLPLKRAFFKIMDDLGIDQAQKIIEAAFKHSAVEHFETAIAQAEKFMDMSDETFVETEKLIKDTETHSLQIEEAAEEIKTTASLNRSEALRRRAAEKSLVLSTQTEQNLAGDRSEMLSLVMPKPRLYTLKNAG